MFVMAPILPSVPKIAHADHRQESSNKPPNFCEHCCKVRYASIVLKMNNPECEQSMEVVCILTDLLY